MQRIPWSWKVSGTAVLFFAWAAPTQATLPSSVIQAVVIVECADRQGSGTIVNGQEGYVLTSAHVVIDIKTNVAATDCVVGIPNVSGTDVAYIYEASVEKFVFQIDRARDFAMLKIGRQAGARGLPKPYPFVKTDEFPFISEAITLLGYSGKDDALVRKEGSVQGFEGGFIQTGAEVSPGDSGGAALTEKGGLIGVPTRIVTTVNTVTQNSSTTYELVDIRAVLTWLDTYGSNAHDAYVTHEDFARYHSTAVFISGGTLGCSEIARSRVSPTVYCLRANDTRYGFPNEATFLSWYPDFGTVDYFSTETLSAFRLTRNVTFKPGTLVKSATSPKVYVVTDTFGTMRWIPSETRATELWGPNWASLVHDIPDEFWINYTIGQPLE